MVIPPEPPEREPLKDTLPLQWPGRATIFSSPGRRVTFYTTGMEHSITSATASAWERTPWHAIQGAARDTLRQVSRDD